MGQMAIPALIGAGIGGGVNLARGKDPLKGALIGGALGGAGGGLFGTGGLLNGAAAAETAAIPSTIESAGLAFNQATGTHLAPEYYLGAGSSFPVFTGGQGVFANALGDMASAVPSYISDAATPQNLLGITNLVMDRNAPQMSAPPANIRIGQAPQYQPFPLATTTSWQKKRENYGL